MKAIEAGGQIVAVIWKEKKCMWRGDGLGSAWEGLKDLVTSNKAPLSSNL